MDHNSSKRKGKILNRSTSLIPKWNETGFETQPIILLFVAHF